MNARHNREQEKIVSSVPGEEGSVVSPSARVKEALQNMEEIRTGEAGRETGGEESMRALKERNGRTGAFPPRGYSTFMSRKRDRKNRKRERFSACILHACVCVRHSYLFPLFPVQL